MNPGDRLRRRRAAAALAVAVSGAALAACAWDQGWRGRNRQVGAFDGHTLWVDYTCSDGQKLRVRYLGQWANLRTDDGRLWRLVRRGGSRRLVAYVGQGYSLWGPPMRPTWTTQAGAVRCRGRL